MQTNKQRYLSPQEWSAMKAGTGFWFSVEAVANNRKFLLKVCEKSKMCKDADVKEIHKKFDLFLGAPEDMVGKPTKGVSNGPSKD